MPKKDKFKSFKSGVKHLLTSKIFFRLKIGLIVVVLVISSILGLILGTNFILETEGRLTLVGDQLKLEANNQNRFGVLAQTLQPTPTPLPQLLDQGITPPQFSALGVLAIDVDSGKILYEKNMHGRLSPASTTKMMTALVAVEYFKPADILVVTAEALVGGSTMGLNVGEKLTFRSLLYGMLLNSGNDAAYTIAANYPGGLDNFVLMMNKKAQELGLQNTNFQNPAGFDGLSHYSSPWDLSKIAQAVVANPQLAKAVSTKETEVTSMDKTSDHSLKNLNQLLTEPGVIGIKTGFTEKSGENLVLLVDRDDHKTLSVILGSQDRFGESKALIDWVYNNFKWQ